MEKEKTIPELTAECKKIDKILFEVEEEFKEIENISQKLKDFSEKMKVLETFYFDGDWIKDKERLEKEKQDNFYCMSEDGIWNMSVAYQQEQINIIKQLVQEL